MAHEAAHVIRQRAGVNLSGGVGRAGDPYEQHADAVADMVVQGRSAEPRLEQYAGGSQAGGAAVQRESSFDGLLPKHETFGDSYAFKGRRSTDFTYHHIIPESKLKKVTEQLTIIRDHLDDNGQGNENSEIFDIELSRLLTDARKGWLKTRVKNTTYLLQQEFEDLSIQIPESRVEEFLAEVDPKVNDTHGKFRAHYKEQLLLRVRAAMREARRAVPAMLRTTRFHRDGWGNAKAFEQLWANLDPDVYVFETLQPRLEDALQAVRNEDKQQGIRGTFLNNASVMKHINLALETYNLETYFDLKFPELSSTQLPQGILRKLLQENALPHDESEHLEHAVQWNPGNIHRGPESKKRLNPDSGREFDELVDDGGDNFEKAAANLVEMGHYEALEELNRKIDKLVAAPIPKSGPNDNKIEAPVEIVKQMHALMKFGLTEFDESQWEMKGDHNMRLKKDEDKLRAVGLIS